MTSQSKTPPLPIPLLKKGTDLEHMWAEDGRVPDGTMDRPKIGQLTK